jgi:hypothetical protein
MKSLKYGIGSVRSDAILLKPGCIHCSGVLQDKESTSPGGANSHSAT